MSIIENLESDIEKQKQILAELELKLKETKLQSPDKLIATVLHNMLCRWNHTDGCGWFYEFKDKQEQWDGSTHGQYLAKARKLIHKCEELNIKPEDALVIYRMMNEL